MLDNNGEENDLVGVEHKADHEAATAQEQNYSPS